MPKTILVWCALLLQSMSASAGLFGPSNYDECILDGVKDAKTELAAGMVARACRNKFPLKEITPPKDYGSIRVSFYDDKTGLWDSLNNKIKTVSFKDKNDYLYGPKTEVRVMNNYGFGLAGIYVGVISKNQSSKSCPSNSSGYKEIIGCGGQAGAKQAGTFTCDRFTGSFCVTGFMTEAGDHSSIVKKLNDELGQRMGK